MTGSASKRWTFLKRAIAYSKGRGLGKGGQSDFCCARGWRIAPKCYIYIYIYIYAQNSLFGGPKNKSFWIGFSMIF